MFYYLLTTENELRELESDTRYGLSDYYNLIDCDCISYVMCIDKTTNMIIDDEGKLKHKPINTVATLLYGALPYDCIAGDVLLCTTKVINDIGEQDFWGYEESQIPYLKKLINDAYSIYRK